MLTGWKIEKGCSSGSSSSSTTIERIIAAFVTKKKKKTKVKQHLRYQGLINQSKLGNFFFTTPPDKETTRVKIIENPTWLGLESSGILILQE